MALVLGCFLSDHRRSSIGGTVHCVTKLLPTSNTRASTLHDREILNPHPVLCPHHLEPLARPLLLPLLRRPLLPHKHHLEVRRRIPRLGRVRQVADRIQGPAVPGTAFARDVGEEVTDIGADVGVEERLVLVRDLRFVDSNAESERVDDAPFSPFAVDGLDFVGVDEAGFHDVGVLCPKVLSLVRG